MTSGPVAPLLAEPARRSLVSCVGGQVADGRSGVYRRQLRQAAAVVQLCSVLTIWCCVAAGDGVELGGLPTPGEVLDQLEVSLQVLRRLRTACLYEQHGRIELPGRELLAWLQARRARGVAGQQWIDQVLRRLRPCDTIEQVRYAHDRHRTLLELLVRETYGTGFTATAEFLEYRERTLYSRDRTETLEQLRDTGIRSTVQRLWWAARQRLAGSAALYSETYSPGATVVTRRPPVDPSQWPVVTTLLSAATGKLSREDSVARLRASWTAPVEGAVEKLSVRVVGWERDERLPLVRVDVERRGSELLVRESYWFAPTRLWTLRRYRQERSRTPGPGRKGQTILVQQGKVLQWQPLAEGLLVPAHVTWHEWQARLPGERLQLVRTRSVRLVKLGTVSQWLRGLESPNLKEMIVWELDEQENVTAWRTIASHRRNRWLRWLAAIVVLAGCIGLWQKARKWRANETNTSS